MSAYSIATRGLAGRKIPQGVLAAINTLLFGSGEQGAWYDPADLSTLFQDSAGTTPVTAVEQPVGLMLDKSGRGNHASQATSTKRPKYSRRVNRVTNTGFSGGVAGAPGTAATGFTQSVTGTPSTYYPASVYDASSKSLRVVGGVGDRYQYSQTISIGAYENILASVNVDNVYTAAAVYQHISAFSVPAGAAVSFYLDGISVLGSATLPSGAHTISALVTNAGTSGTFILRFGAGLQVGLTLAADITFSNPRAVPLQSKLPFQRVNTATDYDADPNKFPAYLACDGIDDAMQTGNIDFTGTDKMTVWAGITKLSDAGRASILELSAGATNLIRIEAPSFAGSPNYFFGSVGSAQSSVTASGIAAPNTSVLTGVGDIAGDVSILRVNSMQAGSSAIDQGAGNYSIAPLYIGARAGTSLFFNGRIYQLIVRGAQSSLSQIEAAELHTRRRMMLP